MRHAPLSLCMLTLLGCSGGGAASKLAEPPAYTPFDQSRCGRIQSRAPLIVEWPATSRAQLESLAKHGLVAVRYEGCDLEVLTRCKVAGGEYAYTPTTRQRDRVTIKGLDELYANLPLGAAGLEGKLRSAGELNVAMTIVGNYHADREAVTRDDLSGECEAATHVVTAVTTGAFRFFAGADAQVGAGVTIANAGAGAKSSSQREILNEGGDEAACQRSTGDDKAPPYDCGALIRLEVTRIAPAHVTPPADAGAEPPEVASTPEAPGPGPSEPRESTGRDGSGEAGGPPSGPRAAQVSTPEPPSAPSAPSAPESPPAKATAGWVYVVGLLGLAALVGVGIAAGVASKGDDAPKKAPHAGLGSATVAVPRTPGFRVEF